MYKKLLFFVGVLLLLSSCTNNYTIEGTVDKMADGAKVLLRKQVNESVCRLGQYFCKKWKVCISRKARYCDYGVIDSRE